MIKKYYFNIINISECVICIIFLMINLESYTFFFIFLFIFYYNKSSFLISSLLPWDHIRRGILFQLPWLLFSPFRFHIFLSSMRGLILYDFVKLLLYAHISWSSGVEIKYLCPSCIILFSDLNFRLELENWRCGINLMTFYSFLRVVIGGCYKLRSF